MAEAIWYIKMRGVKEGPYSVWELRRDARVTRDTLAWRPGMPAWLPIRLIPELTSLFEADLPPGDEGVITLDKAGREQQLLWLLLFLILFVLLFYYL